MKFLNSRVAVVGAVWGVIDVILLVAPLYLYGTSLTNSGGRASLVSSPSLLFTGYTFGPLPAFPVGWFALAVSFVLSFALADVRRALKALVLSGILSFAISPLILISFPTALTSLSPDGIIAFFSFEAVIFFLLGMAGTVFGSFLGSFIEEEPGSLTISLSRHKAFLLAAIVVLVIGTSSVVVGSLVTAEIQNAVANSTRTFEQVVANQTLNWSSGVENVRTDFNRPDVTNSGWPVRTEVVWVSSVNVSFHVMLHVSPVYKEESVHSCGGSLYSNRCDFGCNAIYCGYGTLDLGVGSVFFVNTRGLPCRLHGCMVP